MLHRNPYQEHRINPSYEQRSPSVASGRKRISLSPVAAFLACLCIGISSGCLGFVLGIQSQFSSPPTSQSTSGENTLSLVQTAVSSSPKDSLSIPEIASFAADSVVEITTESVTNGSRMGQYISQGAGSGVVISQDGYIVTNHHVIDGANKIYVRLTNGKSYEATLLGKDPQTDLAVLKISATNLTAAVMGSSQSLRVGELAVAIGNPLGQLGGTVTDGIISALGREITIDGESMTLLQTNAAINPGNSGGGLFNGAGELIGIVNAKSSGSDVEGLGFAIPIDTAKKIIQQLVQNGYVTGRPSLGATLLDIGDAVTAMRYRVPHLGVYVLEIPEGSVFLPGDCILAIGDTAVSTESEVKSLIQNYAVGEKVSISILRDSLMQNIIAPIVEQR